MTNTQILGVVSLVAGVGLFFQRRNQVAATAATTDVGTGRGADLWPDLPSVLGAIGDTFYSVVGGKQPGNTPQTSQAAASLPINTEISLTSPDEYLPLSPVNPQNVGLVEQGTIPQGGDPNLDAWNDSAFADLAWFKAPGETFAPAPPGSDDYLSPGA